jgi:hypothetical protein
MKNGRAVLAAVICDRCGAELLSGTLVTLSVYCRKCRRWSGEPEPEVERAPRKLPLARIGGPKRGAKALAKRKRA